MSITFDPLDASEKKLSVLLADRPVLWVGAGLSMAAGYPSTWDLVKSMRDKALDDIPPDLTFTQAADRFIRSNTRGELSDLLQDSLGLAHDPTETHRAIARMAAENRFAAIITTNYDNLLERVLDDEKVAYISQSCETNFELYPDAGLPLLKIHGSREDWNNTVLSGASYAEFTKRYHRLMGQLNQLMTQRRLLFIGCSMQDPRILDWIAESEDNHLQQLKVWTPILTASAWEAAMAERRNGATARQTYGRLPAVRPMLLDNHDQLPDLFRSVAPPRQEASRLTLTIRQEAGWVAELPGCEPWSVELPAADDPWRRRLDQLRRYDHRALPTDESGAIQHDAAEAHAAMLELAQVVGEQLTERMLSEPARAKLADHINGSMESEPAWLAVRIHAADDAELQSEADRLLALPWELLRIDGRFPVENSTLDITREAAHESFSGLTKPDKPLSVVATIAAPVDSTTLDHETESYRLWKAMGRHEQAILFTDLGTLEAFIRSIAEHKPPVVHFTGHGLPGHLLFENMAAERDEVAVSTLVERLRTAGFPRLIYLASCYGASPEQRGRFAAQQATRESESRERDDTAATASPPADEQRDDERMTDPINFEKTPIQPDQPSATSTAAALHRGGLPQVVAYFGPVGDEQSTRAEAEFYANLAIGRTARQAVRAARAKSAEPVRVNGTPNYVYPLGWAQLALYHRGPDVATTRKIAGGEQLPGMLDDSRQRQIDQLNPRTDGSTSRGVERLRFGFIGRRKPRSQLYRYWQQGRRLLIVHGLGGLGKTTLCTEMLPILASLMGSNTPVLALDGRAAGESDDSLRHLWQQVETFGSQNLGSQQATDQWNSLLAKLQEDGLTPLALSQAISWLAEHYGGLLVYLDDAESLQKPLQDGRLAAWQDEQMALLWQYLSAGITGHGKLGIIASCRYGIQGTADDCHIPLPPMPPADTVKLLRWFPTLSQISRADQDWLATDVVDGHPRTAEFLEELAARRVRKQAGPTGNYNGEDWRRDILNPIRAAGTQKLRADLLLPQLWEALEDDEREHLSRCAVLSSPAPWAAIVMLGNAETGAQLARAGLLSPTNINGGDWYAPHRLVAGFVQSVTTTDATTTHAQLGAWYAGQFGSADRSIFAHRAVDHFLKAEKPNEAWPLARLILLSLRRAGRYREALSWPQRILKHQPTGPARGLALAFEWQLGNLASQLPKDPELRLLEAAELVELKDKSFVLDELAKLYVRSGDLLQAKETLEESLQLSIEAVGTELHPLVAASMHSLAGVLTDQGELAAARQKLERTLEISTEVFGTELHPQVAASMHELARVLKAQGELAAARQQLERTLEIKAEVFRTEIHPEVAASMHELAMICQAEGDAPEAIRLLQRVIAIEQQVYRTTEHPSTAETEVALGQILIETGEVDEGVQLLTHALHVFHTRLGAGHFRTQQLRQLLARIVPQADDDTDSTST